MKQDSKKSLSSRHLVIGSMIGIVLGFTASAVTQTVVDPSVPSSGSSGSSASGVSGEKASGMRWKNIHDGNIQLLQDLRLRKKELDQREDLLAQRKTTLEKEVQQFEKRLERIRKIQQAVVELKNAECTSIDVKDECNVVVTVAEANCASQETGETNRMDKLADLVSKMKPKAAAQLLAALDAKIAVMVLRGVNSRVSGKIMNQMPAEKAAELSERFVEEKKRSSMANVP
jgi:flagellar motility protein MotE (MotC chaperone)